MGRSTEHASDRKKTKFTIGMHMKSFVHHSAIVLKNKKIFDPEKDLPGCSILGTLSKSIMDTSFHINMANEIKVGNTPALAEERLSHQEKALAAITVFLMTLVPAKEVFGGKSKKYWHWAEKAKEIKEELKLWNASEKKKFTPLIKAQLLLFKKEMDLLTSEGESFSPLSEQADVK